MATVPRAGGFSIIFTTFPPAGGGSTFAFPAYITNISDSFNGSWDEHKEMGRGDPKFMYSQYSRTITVSFKTAGLSTGEHKTWLKTLNNLADTTKPQYKGGVGFNGIICRMQIGDFVNTVGFIESLTVTVDNETPWIDKLPIYISADVSFRVIEDRRPDYTIEGPYADKGFDAGLVVG